VLGLVLAWGASAPARRPPTKRYTYNTQYLNPGGFGKSSSALRSRHSTLKLLLCISEKNFAFRIKSSNDQAKHSGDRCPIKPVEFL